MWRVNPPEYTAVQTFRTCIGRIRNNDLKERLQASEGEVEAAEKMYASAAEKTNLYSLARGDFLLRSVSSEEMIAIYRDRMAKKRAAGRVIYDDIILSAKDGRCPLCGQRSVSTLDHHLPKTVYPSLAVAPLNLVPACADCNKAKSDFVPVSKEEEPLHPYFDSVENECWLKGSVVENFPASIRFFPDPPDVWSLTTQKRVKKHFRSFGLSALYAAQAAQELDNIKYYLTQLYEANDEDGAQRVRDHLQEQAESRRRAQTNSWQTATYQALSESDWYCDGGFKN